MNNKVVYVKANFKPVGKYESINVPTGQKKKTLLGGERAVTAKQQKWVQTGFSDREIDGELLSQEIQQAIVQLNSEGYEVVGISDVISGNYSWHASNSMHVSYGYGYGYSYTEGTIIIARKSQ